MVLLKIYYEHFYKNNIEKKDKYECDQEWEILTNKCYFRKNIAYYYTDLKIIRLGLIRHADFQNKLQLSIQVIVNEQINNFNIFKVAVVKVYSFPNPYSFEYIEAYFDLNIDFNKNTRINVKVFNKQYSTKKSIELIIKRYNENDNVKKHSMFCGRICYSNDYIKYLDYWIKMIKISGYDLIALFNHTYNSDFNKIYSKAYYRNFIDMNQLNCLPNLSINNGNRFINFNDIKSQYLLTLFFQIFSLNECYLMYKDKYKYIGVFDFDELILPRVAYNNNNNETNESFYINFDQYPDKIDPISNKPSKLIPYLDSLEFISKLEKKVNIRFEMSNYLKHETVHKIFLELENMFKLNLTKYKINQNKIFELDFRFSKEKVFHLNSYITIETEQDYKYAKHLYEMHKKYIEPFLEKNHNEIEKLVPKIFNRFYYFTSFIGVDFLPAPKTIHYTNQTDLIDIHVPFNIKTNDSIILSTEYGHLSHFRELYKRSFKNSSIQRIFFDFNYFNNYFKTLLKKNKLIYNYI
jgi:hypothetical protein